MLPFKTMIPIDERMGMPVYVQIANGVIKQILKGRIKPGLKMPGSRSMAKQLGVHRNTIIASYEELEAQGWVTAIPAKGSFINQSLPIAKAQRLKKNKLQLRSPLEQSGFKMHTTPPTFLLSRRQDYPLQLDDGCPDVRIAPIHLLARHYKSLLTSSSKHKFDYNWDLQGNIHLRKALVKYLSETRGINVTVDNILITRGSLMGFYLLFKNLIKKGDKIIVGETNYKPVNQIIKDFGGQLVKVNVDDQGIDVDQIEAICKKEKIRAVYVIPHHHHPTTVSLSCDRRMKLLMLAEEHRFAIVEDDYDFDFHYKSSPILPLMSSDEEGLVLYIGSFSKCLAPALRLGYVVAPQNIIQYLLYSRRYIDRQGDNLMERALAMMMEEGELRRHLRKALIIYKNRRDHLCQLFHTHLPDKIKFKIPEGGLSIWAQYAASIDLNIMVKKAASKGLFIVNPSIYAQNEKNGRSSRIGFASMTIDELSQSVEILKKVLNEM